MSGLVTIEQFTGEVGGLLALAYASGALTSFGFAWVFLMLPTRKLLAEAKKAYEDERRLCEDRITRLEARHANDVANLQQRIGVLESFLNIQTLGNLNQARQLSNSAHNVIDDVVEVKAVAREIQRRRDQEAKDED